MSTQPSRGNNAGAPASAARESPRERHPTSSQDRESKRLADASSMPPPPVPTQTMIRPTASSRSRRATTRLPSRIPIRTKPTRYSHINMKRTHGSVSDERARKSPRLSLSRRLATDRFLLINRSSSESYHLKLAAQAQRLHTRSHDARNYMRLSQNDCSPVSPSVNQLIISARNKDSCSPSYGANLRAALLSSGEDSDDALTYKGCMSSAYSPTTLYRTKQRRVYRSSKRTIRTHPERILGAPMMSNDFYLNILDWSATNVLSVGIDHEVYLYDPTTGSAKVLMSSHFSDSIASTKFDAGGSLLAVGLQSFPVRIYDVQSKKRLRSIQPADARCASLAFRQTMLTIGARDGSLTHHDLRVKGSLVAESTAHNLEVCGLRWRDDGDYLSSGGNDNLVCIWDGRNLSSPLHEIRSHNAAVKAMNWCPWQRSLLATGGGSNDRRVCIWDINKDLLTPINSRNVGAQVSGVFWSHNDAEVLATLGNPHNSLSFTCARTMKPMASFRAHEDRILQAALCPAGTVLSTIACDGTLSSDSDHDGSVKFWRVFEGHSPKKSRQAALNFGPSSNGASCPSEGAEPVSADADGGHSSTSSCVRASSPSTRPPRFTTFHFFNPADEGGNP